MKTTKASKSQTGMLGVYLVASEMTYLGFIVSVTSRNAIGADLLVTDEKCKRTWSVQVKTNRQAAGFWLLNEHAREIKSPTHVYVFVNLKGNERPAYYIVPSEIVAGKVCVEPAKSGTFYSFARKDAERYSERSKEVFVKPRNFKLRHYPDGVRYTERQNAMPPDQKARIFLTHCSGQKRIATSRPTRRYPRPALHLEPIQRFMNRCKAEGAVHWAIFSACTECGFPRSTMRYEKPPIPYRG